MQEGKFVSLVVCYHHAFHLKVKTRVNMHMARQLFKYNRVRTQERGVYYTKWREDEAGSVAHGHF